jgi:hypothetical protein
VQSGASGARNINALFLMLASAQNGFDKKNAMTRYAELVFLHPVRSAGHVVHSIASRAQNINAFFNARVAESDSAKIALGHITPNLFFCIRWDQWVTYCISVRLGHEALIHYFSCSGGTDMDSIKSTSKYVTSNLYFWIRWDL